jgi:hypothetical protein
MKVCPQCNSVFGDDFVYCSNDGAVLIEENLSLPTEDDDEAQTVIRRKGEPIVVDVNEPSPTQAETVEMNYGNLPPTQSAIVVERKSNSKFYALFLIVGLLLGGGLVLATLLASKIINRPAENTNVTVQTKTNGSKSSPTPQNTNTERDNEVDKIANEIHTLKDPSKTDDDFNGRVIVENANVRSAPNNNATQVDILPDGDRLTIERRASETSPWYYVVCEHGVSGWMHGNTIEFTRDNF